MVGEEKRGVEYFDVDKIYNRLQMAAWTGSDGAQSCVQAVCSPLT